MPRPHFDDVPLCEFCGLPSSLLCDGVIPARKLALSEIPGSALNDGATEGMTEERTCDKRMCRDHARTVAFLRLAGPQRHDTRDLCPDCVKAGREAKF